MTSERLTRAPRPGQGSVAERPGPLRLLIAIPFAPRFDSYHGGRVIAQLLIQLMQRHSVAVVYLRIPGSAPIDPALASRCELLEEVTLVAPRWPGPPWRHRMRVVSSPFSRLPSPVAAVFDRRFAAVLREAALSWSPDIIQIEHDALAYCAPHLHDLDCGRLLVCHDPGLSASKDLVATTRGRQRLAHRLDAAAWHRYWWRTLPSLDAIVAFTAEDALAIRDEIPSLRVVRIPLAIDLPPQPLNAAGSGTPGVLFIGGYSHQPNADAALRLVHSIMPLARRRIPDLHLTLVGDKPTEEMQRAASPQDTITGPVASVTPYLNDTSLLVLPIRVGGGMRVKLLEALASGKAVIASPRAASGLDVVNGRELVVAETDQEFAHAIARLLPDRAARERLGRNARNWAMRKLTWHSRVSEYEQLYASLLPSTR